MKTALICGISGQDGSYLAKFLLEKGYKVFGTSRDAQISSFSNLLYLGIKNSVTVLSMASTDFHSVLQTVLKIQPDEIYNLAGQSSVALSFDQPVETMVSISIGTIHLLEAIRFVNLPVRFYNASSSECFGNTGGVAASEETLFQPRSPYAVAKSGAHWAVANYRDAYNMFACNGILFNHESCLRPERFVTRKIIKAVHRIATGSRGKLHLGNISIARDWGWAPDYVGAMWKMLQQDIPDDYVIATGETHTLEDFVAEAFSIAGLDWHDHVVTDSSLLRASEIMVSRADPTKAADRLQWKALHKMSDVVRLMLQEENRNLGR